MLSQWLPLELLWQQYFLAPGTGFVEGKFSMLLRAEWFGDDSRAFPVAQVVKNLPIMQENWV